jgi:hypothetical protein
MRHDEDRDVPPKLLWGMHLAIDTHIERHRERERERESVRERERERERERRGGDTCSGSPCKSMLDKSLHRFVLLQHLEHCY